LHIQKELSKIITSVEMMKRKVMNRNVVGFSRNSNNNDDNNHVREEQEAALLLAKKDASLLQMIQIQVWIRMMMWSLEGDAGWTYLEQVVKLSEEEEEEENGNVVDDVRVTVKKGKKTKQQDQGKLL